MQNKTCMLLVDPQKDFTHPKGALYVQGADKDCERLAKFIIEHLNDIDEIYVTMDTHKKYDIAHPGSWLDDKGNIVNPMTLITDKDLIEGRFIPSRDEEWANFYVNKIKKHFIWPEHCLVGTWGHSLDENIRKALDMWEGAKKERTVKYIIKGLNPRSEYHGAFMAHVHVPNGRGSFSESTDFNFELLDALVANHTIFVAGEALSHCVAMSLDQFFMYASEHVYKIRLIRDCTSNVPGFNANETIKRLEELGGKMIDSNDWNTKWP